MSKNSDLKFVDRSLHLTVQRDVGDAEPAFATALSKGRARANSDKVNFIRSREAIGAQGQLNRLSDIAVDAEGRAMTDAEFREYQTRKTRLLKSFEEDKRWSKIESDFDARVTREPGPYDAGSPHSAIRDFFAAQSTNPLDPGATEARARQTQHLQDVQRAFQKRTDYGRHLERVSAERHRHEDPRLHEQRARDEVRSLTTGGGATAASTSGASVFVSPAILVDAWSQYRSPYAAFCGQCNQTVNLPTYGLEAYVPVVTGTTVVATQTEGSGVSEGDPVTNFAVGAIVNKAGQITVTQQTLDRVGPGIAGDALLFAQLKNQLAAQVDLYAIQQALAGAQAVTNAGTFAMTTASSVGGLAKDIKSAKNLLHDTAGVRLRASHLFAVGDFCDYVTAYADAQGRPMFSPTWEDSSGPISAAGDPQGQGYTGFNLFGVALFADDNIPASGSNVQLIVTRPREILLLQGDPVVYVCPAGSVANNLEAVLGVRQYVTAIARYPSGVSVISGAAYTATTFA
jgi:hypothetical protein